MPIISSPRLLSPDTIRKLRNRSFAIPWTLPIRVIGNPSLLRRRNILILNSRRRRTFSAEEAWWQHSYRLAGTVSRSLDVPLCSHGILHHDLLLRFFMNRRCPLILVRPPARGNPVDGNWAEIELGSPFKHDVRNYLILQPVLPAPFSKQERFKTRDRLMVALSDTIYTVLLRRNSSLQPLLTEYKSGRNINTIIATPSSGEVKRRAKFELGRQMNRTPITGNQTTDAEDDLSFFYRPRTWDHLLFHYTRSFHGPWPEESMPQFLDSLLTGSSSLGRSAFASLVRILQQRQIRGSGHLIRGGQPVVCFTDCEPETIVARRRWLNHLARWNFEPYGLALQRSFLFTRGVQPVRYASSFVDSGLDQNRQWLYQKCRSGHQDWTGEQEWRLPGHLTFRDIALNKLLAIVPSDDEAQTLLQSFGCRVHVLRDDIHHPLP